MYSLLPVDLAAHQRGSGIGEDTYQHYPQGQGIAFWEQVRVEVDEHAEQVQSSTCPLQHGGPLAEQKDGSKGDDNRDEVEQQADGNGREHIQRQELRALGYGYVDYAEQCQSQPVAPGKSAHSGEVNRPQDEDEETKGGQHVAQPGESERGHVGQPDLDKH